MAAVWVIKLVPFSFPMRKIQTLRQLESVGPYSLGVPCDPSVTPKQFLTSNRAPVFRQLRRQWDLGGDPRRREKGECCLVLAPGLMLSEAPVGDYLAPPGSVRPGGGTWFLISKQGLPEKPLVVSWILAFFHMLGECLPWSGAVVLQGFSTLESPFYARIE